MTISESFKKIVTTGMFVHTDELLCLTHVVTICVKDIQWLRESVSRVGWPKWRRVWILDRLPHRKPAFPTVH